MYNKSMTIYALSSGPGVSGIAVIRISGKKRDELQQAIQLIKDMDLKFPLQYTNFRD